MIFWRRKTNFNVNSHNRHGPREILYSPDINPILYPFQFQHFSGLAWYTGFYCYKSANDYKNLHYTLYIIWYYCIYTYANRFVCNYFWQKNEIRLLDFILSFCEVHCTFNGDRLKFDYSNEHTKLSLDR